MYRGQKDDPLSETGWQQMRDAVADKAPWDLIVSSPMKRCHDFAQELSAQSRLPLIVEPRFREIGFGVWEGKTAAEIMETDGEQLQAFWRDPLTHRPEGAEPLTDFNERVGAGLNDLLSAHQGKHILVVGHGGQIRMVLQHVLDIPLAMTFRIQVNYAAVSRIRIDHDGLKQFPQLVFHAGSMAN